MDEKDKPLNPGEPTFLLPKDGEIVMQFRNSLIIKVEDSVQVRSLSAEKRQECKTFPKGMALEDQVAAAKKHVGWYANAVQLARIFQPGDKIVEAYRDAVIVDAQKDWQVVLPKRGVRSACLHKQDMTAEEKLKSARNFVDWLSLAQPKRQIISDPTKEMVNGAFLEEFKKGVDASQEGNSQQKGNKNGL